MVIKKLGKNFIDRFQGHPELIAAVPDLHGYFETAKTAIKVIETLGIQGVFLGDYTDRGPSSRETIRALREAQARNGKWRFLLGNHEAMLLSAVRTGLEAMPQKNSAFQEYGGKLPDEDVRFLNSLRPFYKSRHLTFCHAGVPNPRLPIERHNIDDLIWRQTHKEFKGKAVVGHTIVEEVRETNNCVFLETGLWSDGVLSLGILTDSPNVEKRLIAIVRISAAGEILGGNCIDE